MTDELKHPEADSSKSNIVLEREAAAAAAPIITGSRGALPDDFPGKSALDDAGIDTWAKVRNYGDLTDVPGIGAATEARIQERLAEDAKGAGA